MYWGAVQEKEENEASTHLAETIHPNITAGAAIHEQVTDVPQRRSNVKVRGGRKGKGSPFMTVSDISGTYKKISEKNKILEELSGKNGQGGSPKRKFESENSDMDSPKKRNKFNSTRHFWLQLEGLKNLENLEPGSEENVRGQCEDGILCEQLED